MSGAALDTVGRLTTVDVRTVWPHEAHAFTPWLLAHADQLGEVLAMDLELRYAEHPVGDFSLDLIGADAGTGELVIIENQLTATDHGHLGQLLTYAGGTDPTTVVWLAATFRPEHRQALDWLNQRTGPETRFFGVEVAAVRIGDSLPAALFRVVAQPNDWGKQVRVATHGGGVLSERVQRQRMFWEKLLERLHATYPGWTKGHTPPAQNWLSISAGMSGVSYTFVFGHGHLRSEIFLGDPDQDLNTRRYIYLAQRQDAVEAAYGGPLLFDPLLQRKGCRISDRRDGHVDDEHLWDDHITWLLDSGRRLRAAITAVGGLTALRDPTAPVHQQPPADTPPAGDSQTPLKPTQHKPAAHTADTD